MQQVYFDTLNVLAVSVIHLLDLLNLMATYSHTHLVSVRYAMGNASALKNYLLCRVTVGRSTNSQGRDDIHKTGRGQTIR